jgi:4'-phosphopantetheinyl transferase
MNTLPHQKAGTRRASRWPNRRPSTPAAWQLGHDEVAVWRAPLEENDTEAVRLCASVLSRDEAERAQRFYFSRDRRRFVLARGILRMLLARYLGRPAEAILFHYGTNGKPALAESPHAVPLHFNVSHSESLALLAFTRIGEVGVDLERIRALPDRDPIAEMCFSPEENARLHQGAPALRNENFFQAWTRQEAALKALGTGLGGVRMPALAESGLSLFPLDVGADFAAALAVPHSAPHVSWHDWPPPAGHVTTTTS